MVAAGILANTQEAKTTIFDNCINNGTINLTQNKEARSVVGGGIFGYSYFSDNTSIAFISCESNGQINFQGNEGTEYSGTILGGWGIAKNPYLFIYMKDCKSNNVLCSCDAISKYDVTEARALLTIKNGDTSKVYYMGTSGITNPTKADKSDTWAEVTNCTATVNYNWENKTITVEYN